MASAGKKADVRLDLGRSYQTIDGFGVNFNSKYWIGSGARLKPAVDLLLEDLGARLFRVDIWGKSDWPDPTGELGPSSLQPDNLARVYQGEIFQRGWNLMRYLNERGIEPYLTASGDVPPWMLAADGKTLRDYDAFCEMLASMVDWARSREGLRFTLFGPLNETDLGSPEGPSVSPEEYVKVCETLDEKLCRRDLMDIRFVVPEQARFDPNYLRELVKSRRLRERIGVFSMHDYADLSAEDYRAVIETIRRSNYADKRLWFGEFGDLEQSGEKEWYVAWVMVSRLLDHLSAGFNASLAWDAFDNYHDHDEWWTIYGLIRTGLRAMTPKKRYYALKHVYRFVLPGFQRVPTTCGSSDLRVLAFASQDRQQISVVGMNLSSSGNLYLNVEADGLPEVVRQSRLALYRTSESENCVRVSDVPAKGGNWPFSGAEFLLPPNSIFTLTNI